MDSKTEVCKICNWPNIEEGKIYCSNHLDSKTEGWEDRFDKYMIDISAGSFNLSKPGWELVKSFISQEISKAKTEAMKLGIDTAWEAAKVEIEKAKEEGRQEVYPKVLEAKAKAFDTSVMIARTARTEERTRLSKLIDEMYKSTDYKNNPVLLGDIGWNKALDSLKSRINDEI